jgi:hypothetical protein
MISKAATFHLVMWVTHPPSLPLLPPPSLLPPLLLLIVSSFPLPFSSSTLPQPSSFSPPQLFGLVKEPEPMN